MPFEGDTLPLSFQLHDGAEDKYVRATVVDDTGSALTGSPVSMGHLVAGKYTSDAIVMPAGVKYVEATYDVFNDAGFTVESEEHFSGGAVFPFEIPDQVIVDKLDQIISILNVLQGLDAGKGLVATVKETALTAVLEETIKIKAMITDESQTAAIERESLTATVEDDEIEGEIDG